MPVAYSKKHQKCEVAVVKEDKKRKIFLYFYASYHLFSKVQMEFRMVRSGLVKDMPAKTGYLRRFSESIQTRVKILIFVTLKIKKNQNKHAFYTFEGILMAEYLWRFLVFKRRAHQFYTIFYFRHAEIRVLDRSDCCGL